MVAFQNVQTKGGLLMNTTKLKEKPMPIIYTTEDICKIFHIGRVVFVIDYNLQFTVATPLNTDNVHNHIVVNSVSFKSVNKFYSNR